MRALIPAPRRSSRGAESGFRSQAEVLVQIVGPRCAVRAEVIPLSLLQTASGAADNVEPLGGPIHLGSAAFCLAVVEDGLLQGKVDVLHAVGHHVVVEVVAATIVPIRLDLVERIEGGVGERPEGQTVFRMCHGIQLVQDSGSE